MVNLYPFYDKVTSTGQIEFDDGIENIDIGGPAMIRAAAKVVLRFNTPALLIRLISLMCCFLFIVKMYTCNVQINSIYMSLALQFHDN